MPSPPPGRRCRYARFLALASAFFFALPLNSQDFDSASTSSAGVQQSLDPAAHHVDLSWHRSKSKHVVGYNLYRGKSGGPYKKINGKLNEDTNYTDHKVKSGHKYCYVATAVNSRGRESNYSKEKCVNIGDLN